MENDSTKNCSGSQKLFIGTAIRHFDCIPNLWVSVSTKMQDKITVFKVLLYLGCCAECGLMRG